jgi:uncharacterized protein (TIGR00106 family)
MHSFIVNASLQILPIVNDKHPYLWVDEAIAIIRKSGIKYEVGPFATILVGKYEEVMEVVNNVNEYLYSKGCTEWIASVQIQLRCDKDITAEEKVAPFKV